LNTEGAPDIRGPQALGLDSLFHTQRATYLVINIQRVAYEMNPVETPFLFTADVTQFCNYFSSHFSTSNERLAQTKLLKYHKIIRISRKSIRKLSIWLSLSFITT